MAAALDQDRDWAELEGVELASAVCRLVDSLESDQQGRKAQMLADIRRFEARQIDSLDAQAYVEDPGEVELTYPVERSLVETVHADLTRAKLKPRFLTSGADWQTQRRAIKLQRFVVGQLHTPQGQYADGWDVFDEAWKDSEITGEGYCYVWADYERRCVAIERVPPWQILVDPTDAEYGCPGTLCREFNADKRRLISLFVDGDPDADQETKTERRNAILAAQVQITSIQQAARVSERCKVREIWRLPVDDEQPGKHVLCVEGAVLFDEPWEYDSFPVVQMRWSRQRTGWQGTGLVYESSHTADALNQCLQRMIDGYRLRNGRRTYYRPGSLDVARLQDNDAETFIPVESGNEYPQPEVVPALAPGEIDFTRYLVDLCHESTGVSRMMATAQKEPGLNSGRAIRAGRDIGSARFLPKASAREAAFKQLCRLVIRCSAELAEEHPGLISKWPGQQFLKTVEWKKASIDDEDLYTIEIDAENATATDVAGRTAALEEGLASGIVSADTFARLQSSTLDIDRESDVLKAEQTYVEDLIDRFLDAEPDDPEFEFEEPEGFMIDKAGALSTFIRAYFDARYKGAPEFNLELMRRWITGLDRVIARAAQPPPQTGGAPVVPGAATSGPIPSFPPEAMVAPGGAA